jgi:hypothetical protein
MKFRSASSGTLMSRDPAFRLSILGTGVVSLAVLAAMPFCAPDSRAQQNMGSPGSPALHDAASWPPISPLVNRHPDANRLLADFMQLQDSQKHIAELNLARQKEMTADTAKLLTLANELKADTEKASNDSLPMDEVRKAEQIAKLAHAVHEKMRMSVSE